MIGVEGYIQYVKKHQKDLENLIKYTENEENTQKRIKVYKTMKKILRKDLEYIEEIIRVLEAPTPLLSVEEL